MNIQQLRFSYFANCNFYHKKIPILKIAILSVQLLLWERILIDRIISSNSCRIVQPKPVESV